ncbi:MAG: hypothetical protein ACI4S3_10480 [Candidatus Gastranaerophilaceae bacterium]
MDISSLLNSEMSSKIQLIKMDMLSSVVEEIEEAAVNVAETGDPAYILELSPMALAMFNQSAK